MFPKTIKTYLRKPAKSTSRIPPNPAVPRFSDSEDEGNDEERGKPLDDTFDRLRKTAKPVPISHVNNSTVFYNSTSSSDTSELEVIPIPVVSVKRGKKRKTSRNVDKIPKNPSTTNKVLKRNKKQNNIAEFVDDKIQVLEEKKGIKKNRKKNKNEKLSAQQQKQQEPVAEEEKQQNFSSELSKNDLLDAEEMNFRSDKLINPSFSQFESSKIDEESLKSDPNPPEELPHEKNRKQIMEIPDTSNESTKENSEVFENTEKMINLRKRKVVSKRMELDDKSEELEEENESSRYPRRRGSEIKEKSLSPSTEATNECWVSLYRLKLRDKIEKRYIEDDNESTNSRSMNTSGPISILVSSAPGDDSIDDSKIVQKENSVEEKSEEFSRSLNIDNSLESSSLFSTTQSTNESVEKSLKDESKSFSIVDKSVEIDEKREKFGENAIDNCSVVLQRYDKSSKNRNLTVNQTLLSSTPLFTRMRHKSARLQLSPIPIPSSVPNRRNKQSIINDNSLEKESNRDSSGIVTKLTKNMTSISIIDEDTEINESIPSEIILTKIVDDSLKEKVEKQLFSSIKSVEDIEEHLSTLPEETISSIRKWKRISSINNSSSENSVMITNSTIDISSRISDSENNIKNELTTIKESSGVVSPLMFEDSEEEEIQNEVKEKSGDDSCEVEVEVDDETMDSEVGDEEEKKIEEIGVDVSSKLISDVSSDFSSDNSLDIEENEEENLKNTLKDSINVSIDEIEEKEEEVIDSTIGERRETISKVQMPDVCSTRLDDPVGVTARRYRYTHRDKRLSAISETVQKRVSDVPEEKNDPSGDIAEESVEEAIEEDIGEVKSVFLKPGKFWARSLSILNNIQSDNDLEELGKGKGKNWRQSVISVLNMQSQGLVQSCISKNENKAQSRSSRASSGDNGDNAPRKWSSTNRLTSQPSSPGRFIRRVSIRVVPDNKSSKLIDKVQDSSFLEAYGITTSKDRQTLVQQSIAPVRKSSYNFRNSAINPRIPEPLTIARNVVLDRCNQTDSCPFTLFYNEEYLKNCRKIGEGVYGEVFLFDNGREKSVIKIIPIEGSELVNGEPQKKFDEILSEIIIAKELHDLRVNENYRTDGFVEVKNIRCLRGKYPDKLVELWGSYDEEKKSDNDCPSMFKEEQLYIALELGDGGKDLEGFVFQNASEAYSSFIQTALTLAVAEKSLDFEHRDLHWGNILISRTTEKSTSYKLNSNEIEFPCQGVKVSIIDFTLSRMSYEGCCIFNDLALDPSLFTAVGEYQFEIYRLMRAKVDNNWQAFEPSTNILWLHYTLDKMITAVRYKRKGTKIHNNYIQRLREVMDVILEYESAFDFVTNCESVKELLQIYLMS